MWKIKKAVGDWALEHLQIDMSPSEAYEAVWLLYELETYNNILREQLKDDKGNGPRLAWDQS